MSGFGKIFGAWGKSSTAGQVPPNDPAWMKKAKAELGEREVPGPGNNPRIVEYLKATTVGDKYEVDATPWCAAFVRWVLNAPGSAAAKSLLTHGSKLNAPKYGCVAVLTRDGGGHVGFVMAWDEKNVTLLGGNQGDAVSIRDYPINRVIGWRWPS